MEDAYRHLKWDWNYQEEDQWKLAQFHSILELETRIACVHKEIARKSDEILHFQCLLTKTINDRDNFQFKCRILSKDIICQHETKNVVDSDTFVRNTQTSYAEDNSILKLDNATLTKRLPEKGKFLQAVMDAGPLLQTLRFVGPLPRWRNAAPKLSAIKIPTPTCKLHPTIINHSSNIPPQDSCVTAITCDSGLICKKRGFDFGP